MDHLNVGQWIFIRNLDCCLSLGPVSVAFIIKLRGVPFEAGENDIYKVKFVGFCLYFVMKIVQFFEPVVPIRLEPEETPRGRPPVWYAEFGSREEATEAMT